MKLTINKFYIASIWIPPLVLGVALFSNDIRTVCLLLGLWFLTQLVIWNVAVSRVALSVLLFLLLIMPLIKIDKEEKSEAEKRNLVKYKSIWSEGCLNLNYGSDFDAWINDHFYLRKEIMALFGSWKSFVNQRYESKSARCGKDGWCFLQGDLRRMSNYREDEDKRYEATKKALVRFGDFCKQAGSELCIVVAPYGEEIYGENLIGINVEKVSGKIGETLCRLKEDTGLNLVYAYNILLQGKEKALVYYKTDHHWSQYGSYLGYSLVMKSLGLDYHAIDYYKEVPEKKPVGWGETFRLLNLPKDMISRIYPRDTSYVSLRKKETELCKNEKDLIVNPKGNGKSVFVFGDSYTRNIKKYFGDTFSKTYCLEKPLQIYMPNFEVKIKEYKPDVVVMVVFAQNFELIKNWYGNVKLD